MLLKLLALLFIAGPAMAQTLYGTVASVHDGDTVTVETGAGRFRLHIAEIDAPELRQSYGKQARQSLVDLCLDKPAQITPAGRDSRGSVGRLVCDGVDAGAGQVQRGMAWVYQRQARSDSPLHFLEDEAQRHRAGLWAEAAPAPPWNFRANRRNNTH
jgi:micrococcal nuclease